MKKVNIEHLAADDLRQTLKAGARELERKAPRAAMALGGLAEVVPRLAKRVRGWSREPALDRPFFRSKGKVH